MPDDHSEVVPLLPIPNRTVKRLSADDSAGSRVKVGHRQAFTTRNPDRSVGVFFGYVTVEGPQGQNSCRTDRTKNRRVDQEHSDILSALTIKKPTLNTQLTLL